MATQQHTLDIPFLTEKAIHKIYDNGYQFIYVPKRGDVFNIATWVRTGSIHENAQNNGVSHFLEHLMFKGTSRFKPGEFDKAMESMGAVINAATWKDFTFYYVTGPKGTHNKNFEKAVDMHADMLLYSNLPNDEIGETHDPDDPNSTANKRERGVVIEEIGMREDQPWSKIYTPLNEMMYPEGHPYRPDVIGTRHIIASIPRSEIERYYHTWYSADTMTTIVVGDFDFDWLEAHVLKHFDFSRQPQYGQPKPQPVYPTQHQAQEQRYLKLTGDYQTSFFIMGFHGPQPTELKQSITIDVASRILGEGRSSRLVQALLEKPQQPVFNAISCGQSTFKLGNVFYIQGNFNGPEEEARLTEVQSELKALLNDRPITPEEFRRAVKKMKVDFAETSETASGISETIGESLTVTGSLDDYLLYLETLESLTLEDVHQAAQYWLQPDKAYTTVLVPQGAVA